MLFLPRQFHVAVVENHDEKDIRAAAFTFPLYLLAINFFVIPLAIAGLIMFPDAMDRDIGVMALPIWAENGPITLAAVLGGLSAATAMVDRRIHRLVDHGVERPGHPAAAALWALAPCAIDAASGQAGMAHPDGAPPRHPGRAAARLWLLPVSGETLLASIGMLSFACVAQLGPAFIGALAWRRGTALGAISRAHHRRHDLGLFPARALARRWHDAHGHRRGAISAAPGLPAPDIFNLQMST